jgi:RNA polymerase sigma-70 factor, ECF subfamily
LPVDESWAGDYHKVVRQLFSGPKIKRWRIMGQNSTLIFGVQDLPMTHEDGDFPVASIAAISDGSLVRRFQSGDEDAATALYKRYARRLQRLAERNTGTGLAARFDADDVVQSVFRTFFRRVQKGFYDLPAGGELWQLLLVISLNKIRSLAIHHRAQKRDVSATVAADAPLLSQLAGDNSDELALRSLQMVIGEVLGDLPEVQQRIIMRRIEGCQVEEIAAETGRSKRTVERVLQNFRERLRKLIEEPASDVEDEHQ